MFKLTIIKPFVFISISVNRYSAKNRMNLSNLSRVWANFIIRPDPQQLAEDFNKITVVDPEVKERDSSAMNAATQLAHMLPIRVFTALISSFEAGQLQFDT